MCILKLNTDFYKLNFMFSAVSKKIANKSWKMSIKVNLPQL